MIVGRLSICEHKLLRTDTERSQTGSETLIRRQTQPPLKGEEPPIAPAISVEAGLKGLAHQNPEVGTTDRDISVECTLELPWIDLEGNNGEPKVVTRSQQRR